MASEQHWGLGTSNAETNALRISFEFSEEKYIEYFEAITNVRRLDHRFAIKLVERNHVEYRNLRRFSGILIAMGREPFTIDRLNASELLMGQAVNWLTSVRLYLEHTETDLKRRFGRLSPQVERFKMATANAFDDSFAYRFLYKLRNYVQHCGLPMSTILVDRPSDSTNRFARQRVRFQVDPGQLLATYSEWGPVAKDLRARIEPFELDSLIDEAMERLREIERVRLCIDIDAAANSATRLREMLDRIGDEEGTPTLVAFTTPLDAAQPIQTISHTYFDRSAVDPLLAVARGEVDAQSLLEESTPRQPLALDPANIRQIVATDSRGVQTVVKWLSEGGNTPEFGNLVNRIIQEDDGIGPLVDGLVKVAVVMGHMAGSTLGVTAEGVIAGLMEAYTQFEENLDDDPRVLP